jgi:hypothetical protein
MPRILLLPALALVLFTCASPEREPSSRGLPELERLSPAIRKELFRSTYSHLSDAAYRAKLEAADESPLFFFRSFVNTFYADLSQLRETGPVGFCLGDAHPENFGFLEFPGGVRYVFNDLDDSGPCPLLFDALRFFTAARLSGLKEKRLEAVIDEYMAVLSGQEPRRLPKGYWPDLAKKRRKNLEKYSRGGRLVTRAGLSDPSRREREAVVSAWRQLTELELLDIKARAREGGGSGGLRRFWLLVRERSSRQLELLELKELAAPGTSFSGQPESDAVGPQNAARRIWGEEPVHFGLVQIDGKDFLLRSRTKDDIELDGLKQGEREEVLRVQAGLMAAFHRGQGLARQGGLKRWLRDGSERLEERYRQAGGF